MDTSNMKEWTVMFYFASDNPLAPGVVSLLKAIKQAGFHPEANVIAQFDPQTVGTPTHIFEVNLINKLKSHGAQNIGFDGDDPFVRNLLEDKLWRNQKTRDDKLLRDKLEFYLEKIIKDADYDPPVPPRDRDARGDARVGRSRELSPRQSLENFLEFCVEKYPAKHYMLFILGHGVIVGNDIFLFDEHVNDRNDTLTLVDLGEVLTTFAENVRHQGSAFELVAFHSCSVSSLEVAYELRGTAKYMLASQGPAFVGSWPYREILIRLFNELITCGGHINVEEMIRKIFDYCLDNNTDFLLAGYSFDLCLCNLKEVERIKTPLEALAKALIETLAKVIIEEDLETEEARENRLIMNLILLAHWRAQSFWQESYTDLYDFCFYLRKLCKENEPKNDTRHLFKDIQDKCRAVMWELTCKREEPRETRQNDEGRKTKRKGEDDVTRKIIVCAGFVGPAYQYSHGLSVYFPWSRPADDTQILEEYKRYTFTETRWLEFLKQYFCTTIRPTRKDEDGGRKALEDTCPPQHQQELNKAHEDADKTREDERDEDANVSKLQEDEQVYESAEGPPEDDKCPDAEFEDLLEDIASLVYSNEGELGNPFALSGGKTDPSDPTGDECACPSIKNYPRDTRRRSQRRREASKEGATLLSESLKNHFSKLLDDK